MGKRTCAFINKIKNYKFAAYQAELFKLQAEPMQTEQAELKTEEPKRSSCALPFNLSTGYFNCYYTTTITTTTTTYNNNNNI